MMTMLPDIIKLAIRGAYEYFDHRNWQIDSCANYNDIKVYSQEEIDEIVNQFEELCGESIELCEQFTEMPINCVECT